MPGPEQTVIFSNPSTITNLQTQTNNLNNSLTTQTATAQKIFVGGVQIINSPNRVF